MQNDYKIQKQVAEQVTGYLYNKAIQNLSLRPQKITNLIDKYGSYKVIEVNICRTPINKYYRTLLNIASLGKLSTVENKYGYDDIFHLFMNIKLENGLEIGIEKDAGGVTLVKDGIPTNEDSDCMKLNTTNKNVNLSNFIKKGEKKGGKGFYKYNIHTDNSQKFIYDILTGNEIKSLTKFTLQKIDKILTDKTLKKVSDKIVGAYGLYKHYTDKNDITQENDNKSEYPNKSKRIPYNLPLYNEMMKVLNFRTLDEKVNYFKKIHDENIQHYGELMFELIMSYPKINDQIAPKVADKINKENYGGSKVAFFQNSDNYLSEPDLARSVINLKTLDDRANYLKEMYFINDKSYSSAMTGFYEIYDHDEDGKFLDPNVEKMIDEINAKVWEKIEQAKRK